MKHDIASIDFLDISIIKDVDGHLHTNLFRKPTAGNTILHSSSFHPYPLIRSIPYGQYLRLRRNCSKISDFQIEANKLRDRLIARGYSKKILKKAYKKAIQPTRHTLLFNTKQKNSNQPTKFIMRYCDQHQKVNDILNKYWYLLLADPTLKPHITEKPSIIYRRAKSLRDNLIKSEFKNKRGDPCKTKGTYKCGTCNYCQYMHTTKNVTLPNGCLFKPHHFANCRTPGVVYMLLCECGSFYIGKTIQEFWRRAYRHILSLQQCDPDLPLGRHATKMHGGKFPHITFLILDRVHQSGRGGDWNKRLLQCELRWIFDLNATSPPGLNEAMNFRPFLEGYTSGGWDRDILQ